LDFYPHEKYPLNNPELKGAYPDIKIPTICTRLGQSHVQPALLFFRTSMASRSTTRFLHETRILPPLSFGACIYALHRLAENNDSLEIHYADEEGDPYAVELAGRVGGYVVGNDSDFVILNAPGYLGYIPLDDMMWETAKFQQSLQVDDEPDNDFRIVSKTKSKKKHEVPPGRGIIPPEGVDDLHLSCTVYHPDILASQLKLPVTLLPLLGALVGNDFTHQSDSDRRSIQHLLFDRRLTLVQRIENAAAAMRSIMSPASSRKKSKYQVGSVMDFIDRTVHLLLSRLSTPPNSGEVDEIVDKVVTAALQYAINKVENTALWPSPICVLHEPDLCPFLPFMSRRVLEESEGIGSETPALVQSAAIREHYMEAYRKGLFSPLLIDVLCTGTSWPRLFLENPDLETVSCSITRPLRCWIYSVLDDSLGLPISEEESIKTDPALGQNNNLQEAEDDEELIDVVESDGEEESGDFLAPLKGELQRLHISDVDAERDSSVSAVSQRSNRIGSPKVIEYVRRGTRIAAETVQVVSLGDLLSRIPCSNSEADADETISLVQKSIEERFTVFLRILESDLPSVRDVSQDYLYPILAIRWIVRCLHRRESETGSRDREREKWTAREAKCLLATFAFWTLGPSGVINGHESPPVQDRNVQLSAQFLTTMETIEHLVQALLLTSLVPSTVHRFSGKLFHAYLSGSLALPDNIEQMWQACHVGLIEAFREDWVKGKEKKRSPADNATAAASLSQKTRQAGRKAGFSLLANLNE